jgi:hypothetical protein
MFQKLRARLSRRKPPDDDKAARDYNARANDENLDVRVAAKLGPGLIYPPDRDSSKRHH